MKRRTFLQATGVGMASVASLAGCLGGSERAPPRTSNVFREFDMTTEEIQFPLVEDPWVETRADSAVNANVAGSGRSSLSLVGDARGQTTGGGAGGRATGGFSSAPHDDRGRAIFRGNEDDDEWRREHSDEIAQIPATYERIGVTFVGVATAYSDDPPGTGPLEWDHIWSSPAAEMLTYDDIGLGWYRVGAKLSAREADHDFGWEAVDFKIGRMGVGYRIESPWKISPRV